MSTQLITQLEKFMEQHGDEYPAVSEYLVHCQKECPADEFLTAKEIMLSKLKGEILLPKVKEEVLSLIRSGKVVDAIKIHRKYTGSTLKESKHFVDSLRDKHNLWPTQ